jgi:hypothetical protein
MMYLFKIFFVLFIGFVLLGCSARAYLPKNEKKEFLIKTGTVPSSVHETTGRYRIEKGR